MIKFFRHIRQALIMENKTSKYFKYAIGEIILVVIGILIALQINNWNENRKKDSDRIEMLKNMQSEFTITKTTLENSIKAYESRSKILLDLMDYSSRNTILVPEDSLKDKLQRSLMFGVFQGFTTTYEQAISSGKIGLIKNNNLVKALNNIKTSITGLSAVRKELPVFGESYSKFNISVDLLKKLDNFSQYIINPKPHPKLFLTGPELNAFIQDPKTYEKLHHIYFLNSLELLWSIEINKHIDNVQEQIKISLNEN